MNDSQAHGLLAPKWYEPSIYKLYVSPATEFTKASLKEFFAQYADVADVYMSEPNDVGFKWAFVYFTTEEGLLEAVTCIEKDNVHNFKLSRAKPKIFLPNAPKHTPPTKMTNGGEIIVPNCGNCKKLTFLQCSSCKNPFCSKECTLDGWRSHTGPCVKVAELTKSGTESNGHDYSITPTVVNFMKDIKHTKKSFTTKEFADACNFGKGMVSAGPSVVGAPPTVPRQPENAWEPEYVAPEHDKRAYPAKMLPQSFQKQLSISDTDEVDKPMARAAPKKFQKRDNDPSRQPFRPNTLQPKLNNRAAEETARNKITSRKPLRKVQTDVEDCEDQEPNRRKPFPKPLPPKLTEPETVAEPDSYRSEVDRRSSTSAKRDSFKGADRNAHNEPKVTKVAPQIHQSDLKLRVDSAVEVVVTSLLNPTTFFVADRDKVVQMLQQISDVAHQSPGLTRVELNTRCLAFFDNDYYRARVINTDPIQVEYIDYGNRETCTIDSLKVLPESLAKTLPLATKVQLKNGDVEAYDIEENKAVKILVIEKRASENCYIVDVLD